MSWQNKPFSQLSLDQLYDILKLRVDVFVVEQTCFYPELDNLDRNKDTKHLFLYQNDKLSAYLRILPKGTCYAQYIAIGRVVIAEHARGTGLAHELMTEALAVCNKDFPNEKIKMSAQEHLESFYQSHHFTRCSEMYLEDGIPHISMEYQKPDI